MDLLENLKVVRTNIAAAAARARRDPREISLIAVVKNASLEQIQTLVLAGERHLGESRAQQLQAHTEEITPWLQRQGTGTGLPRPNEIIWHMIGHLQRNKVLLTLSLAQYIHGVDSLRLAEEINEFAGQRDHPAQVMLEVNTTGEGSKFGIALPAAIHLAEQIETMANISLVGLMTMAEQTSNPENARPAFARLRELFEEIRFHKIAGSQFTQLSMGMSGDYQIAIEEGATMVRIGTALFGPAPVT